MPHTQISFLGAPQRGKQRGDYVSASYRFPSGTVRTEHLFAIALAQELRPNRILLLGTPGSQWHSLIDWAKPLDQHFEAAARLYDELHLSASGQSTTQQQLDTLEPLLQPVDGIPWQLRLIPTCEHPEHFEQLLTLIAESVEPRDIVSFDITHGLRHLPMLSLLAGLYLRQVKNVVVRDIFYGALELSQTDPEAGKPITPVVPLGGVLDIAKWLDATSRFQASGDFGQFGRLLSTGQADLRGASFFQQTGQLDRLQKRLPRLREALEREGGGAFRLLRPALQEIFDIAAQQDSFHFQRGMAYASLQRGDYLRAAIYGQEAFCTWLVSFRPGHDNFDGRKALLEEFIQKRGTNRYNLRSERLEEMKDYAEQLRQFRNAWAHANPEAKTKHDFTKRYGDPLHDPQSLPHFFDDAFACLLEDLPQPQPDDTGDASPRGNPNG